MRARGKEDDGCGLLYRADNVGFNCLALSPPVLHGSERQTRLTGCLKRMKLLVRLFSFSELSCHAFPVLSSAV